MTFPNRSNDNYPDAEQEKREQARRDRDFANGDAAERPPFTRQGPGVVLPERMEH